MRNFSSIFLLIILGPVTLAMLLVSSIRYNVLTPRFLKHELSSRDVYTIALSQIDEQIAKLKIDPQYPITPEEISTLAHQVFTPSWLEQNVESVIDHFFAWLHTSSGTKLSIPIDLRYPKAQLTEHVDALLASKLPQLQPCPDKKRPKEEQGLCQFAGMSVDQVKEQLNHAGLNLTSIETALPDTLDLVNPDLSKIVGSGDTSNPNSTQVKNAEIMAKLNQVKDGYQQAMRYFLYAWIAYGLLLTVFISLNATKGWSRLSRWTGILLFTMSILPLAVSVASSTVVERAVIPNLNFGPNIPAAAQSAAIGVIHDVRSAIFLPILITASAFFVIGVGGIIGAKFIRSVPPLGKSPRA